MAIVIGANESTPTIIKKLLNNCITRGHESVLEHEKMVSGLINDLVNLAIEEKDHATNNFLQWFVEEQVEEEENAMELLAKAKFADGDNRLMYELNKELGERAPSND